MSAPRTLTDRQLKALGKRLHTDAGMAELMDATFGSDGWVYEAPRRSVGRSGPEDTKGRGAATTSSGAAATGPKPSCPTRCCHERAQQVRARPVVADDRRTGDRTVGPAERRR